MLHCAFPVAFASVPVPSFVVPSMNFTVPVGMVVGEATVAVNVTFWPALEGFAEDMTAVSEIA